MPQFSLKRLFVSVTLIAVGCGTFGWADTISRPHPERTVNISLVHFLLVSSLVLCCAGVANLFNRPKYGIVTGLAISGLMALLAAIIG